MIILKVATESFQFLFKYPGFFIPRLIEITLWNFVYLALIQGFLEFTINLDPNLLSNVVWTWLPWIIIFNQMSIIMHSMYPTLTKDFKETEKFKMYKALKIAVIRWPQTFIVYFIPTLISTILSLPFIIMLSYGILTSQILFVLIGIGITMSIILLLVILFYFSPSQVVLSKGSGMNALRLGAKITKSHAKEAIILTLFSFVVLALAFVLEGTLRDIGILGFLIGRYLGAIFGTYLFVINTDMYLELKNK